MVEQITLSVLLFTVNSAAVLSSQETTDLSDVRVIQYGPNSDGMTIAAGNGSKLRLNTTSLAKIKLENNSCDLIGCAFI